MARTFVQLLPDRFLRVSAQGLLTVEFTPLPTVALTSITQSVTEGVTANVQVSLSTFATADITFDYATSDNTATAGVDYVATSGSGTIVAGQTSATISIPTIIRTGTQGSRAFLVTISNVETVPGEALTVTDAVEAVSITDVVEAPTAPTLSVAAVDAADEGTTLTFRITASDTPHEDITVDYVTSDGTATAGVDYTAASGTATIAAGVLTTDIGITTALRSGYQGARSVIMTISGAETASLVAVTITQPTATGTIAETESPTGDHGYYEALLGHAKYFKDWHLRSEAQVLATKAPSGLPYRSTSYLPESDLDPMAQDACKCVIPPFGWQTLTTSAAGVDDTSLRIPVTSVTNTSVVTHSTEFKFGDRSMAADTEIIRLGPASAYRDTTTSELIASSPRAKYGTTATAHAGGVSLYRAACSLDQQLVMPVNQPSGHTYLITWDTYSTKSWMRTNLSAYKAYRVRASGIYLEVQAWFGGNITGIGTPVGYDADLHIGAVSLRCYGTMQGTTTDQSPAQPMVGQFILWPERWTRWWLKMELGTAPDWMYASLWCADQVQEPVQIYDRISFNSRASFDDWRVELNTSTNALSTGRTTDYPALGIDAFRDLVTYTRNHVILVDPTVGEVSALLTKPA